MASAHVSSSSASLSARSSTTTDTVPPTLDAVLKENALLREQIALLSQQLDWFKRQLFGEKSEKRLNPDPTIQVDLFASLALPVPEQTTPVTETITVQRKNKQRDNSVNDTGLRFDDSVPVQTINVPCPELEGDESGAYEIIGEKKTCRLAQRPGSYVVLEYIRKVIKRTDTQIITTTPARAPVLDSSLADVSFLAGMLVDKFMYHLPLYRQHQRLKQNGIQLSRSTLTYLTCRAIDLLGPIVDAQWQHILQSKTLALDETPIKAGHKQKGKMAQAWFWPGMGDQNEIVFHYAKTRAAKVVTELLAGFEGTLLTDGYSAYSQYAKNNTAITHAGCWAHTRRYFERAQDREPNAANDALAIIGALYTHETHIRNKQLEHEDKLKYRTKHSEPVVNQFWHWCEKQCQRNDLLPGNPLTKALKYAMARQHTLQVFIGDPEVPIDTNHLERGLRPIPMGRKNWLFCWTELGAKQVGIIQSLLVTCKMQGVNPHTYLVDVLQRVSQHPARDVIELTPRVWKEKFADRPLRSDLDMVNQ